MVHMCNESYVYIIPLSPVYSHAYCPHHVSAYMFPRLWFVLSVHMFKDALLERRVSEVGLYYRWMLFTATVTTKSITLTSETFLPAHSTSLLSICLPLWAQIECLCFLLVHWTSFIITVLRKRFRIDWCISGNGWGRHQFSYCSIS